MYLQDSDFNPGQSSYRGRPQKPLLILQEFLRSMEFNFVSLLKVISVVGVLFAVKSLIKLALNAIRKESTLLTIVRSLLDYTAAILAVIWSLTTF